MRWWVATSASRSAKRSATAASIPAAVASTKGLAALRAASTDAGRRPVMRERSSIGEHGRLPALVESQDLVPVGRLSWRRRHPRRAGWHSRDGNPDDARSLAEQTVDQIGRYVSLDHVAFGDRRVARGEIGRHSVLALDRRQLVSILFLDREAVRS